MFYIYFNVLGWGVVSHFLKTNGEEVETPDWKELLYKKEKHTLVTFGPKIQNTSLWVNIFETYIGQS